MGDGTRHSQFARRSSLFSDLVRIHLFSLRGSEGSRGNRQTGRTWGGPGRGPSFEGTTAGRGVCSFGCLRIMLDDTTLRCISWAPKSRATPQGSVHPCREKPQGMRILDWGAVWLTSSQRCPGEGNLTAHLLPSPAGVTCHQAGRVPSSRHAGKQEGELWPRPDGKPVGP